MYLCGAERQDRVMNENWKGGMNEILFFVSAGTPSSLIPPF
jgi:hypothetical protein